MPDFFDDDLADRTAERELAERELADREHGGASFDEAVACEPDPEDLEEAAWRAFTGSRDPQGPTVEQLAAFRRARAGRQEP